MARPLRVDYPGALHHVITRGNAGVDIFSDKKDRFIFLDYLGELVETLGFKLHAYCLMDNHVHLLIETGNVRLYRLMQILLTQYVQTFNKRWGRTGHLLGDRYKSILVDKEAYLLELVRYIHLNPVRAGIVKHPVEYPWSSFNSYISNADDLVFKETIMGYFNDNPQEFEKFTLEGIGKELEAKRVRNYIVYGDEDFVSEVLRKYKRERRKKRPDEITEKDVWKYLKTFYDCEMEILLKEKYTRDWAKKTAILLLRERLHWTYGLISNVFGISVGTIQWHLRSITEEEKNRILESFDEWMNNGG